MLFTLHNLFGWLGAFLVLVILCSGWAPVHRPGQTVPESVRANPASYRPVYVPTYRGGSDGGSGGGWSGGK